MTDIVQLLGRDTDNLLQHRYMTTSSGQLYPPGHDYVGRVIVDNDRPPAVLHNMQALYNIGCLVGTGYLPIPPVDQGVEYSVETSFAADPFHFDPKSVAGLAIETDCNYVASTYNVLTPVSRCYAHHIPFLTRFNYNETLGYPNTYGQTLHVNVEQAFNMGAVAIGTTVYFGPEELRHQIEEISAAFEHAHGPGMMTVLRVHLRNSTFKRDGVGHHVFADLTGQTNHLAATIGIDIVKQKMAGNNGGYKVTNYGYTDDRVYSRLTSENPIDLVCCQLASCYIDRAGLVSSGGAAGDETDLSDAMRIAVINKRADGMGLVLGRKVFKKSIADGVKLTNAVQDAYLDSKVTIARYASYEQHHPVGQEGR